MNSLQLITKLKSKANDINENVLQLFNEGNHLNEIDKELLKKQSVEFYELVLKLKTAANIVEEKPVEKEVPPPIIQHAEPNKTIITPPPVVKEEPKMVMPEPSMPTEEKVTDFKNIVTNANEDEISLNLIEETLKPVDEIPEIEDLPPIKEIPKFRETPPEKPFEKATENKRIQYTVMPPELKPVLKVDEEAPITINERLAQLNKNQTIETKVDNLKTAITLNKKIAFVNDLFKENVVEYAKAIDKFNNAVDVNEALGMLNEYKNQFNWQNDNALYQELTSLINRRFM